MSLWKRTMDYLGLGPDDSYDDYDAYEDHEPVARQRRTTTEVDPRAGRGWPTESETGEAVRTQPRATSGSRDLDHTGARRVGGDDSGVQPRPVRQPSGLRNLTPASADPHTVRPRGFDQAQEVADFFKSGQPVIMNLEAADREVSRRLIDFASGLCYALDGSMEKVASGVYLLKPAPIKATRGDGYDV
jgi:cell division inhibitor SepF